MQNTLHTNDVALFKKTDILAAYNDMTVLKISGI